MNNQTANQVEQVYLTDAQIDRWPKVATALRNLMQNEDFKLLLEELTVEEPKRLVANLGDDVVRAQRPELERIFTENLKAIGIFQSLLRDVNQRGQMAVQASMTDEEKDAIIASQYAEEL